MNLWQKKTLILLTCFLLVVGTAFSRAKDGLLKVK